MRRLAATALAVLGAGVVMSAPASAAAVEYVPGKDVVIGSCKAWLNKRTSDGYIQAVGQSWGDDCYFGLQRKRLGDGGYSWIYVSDIYDIWGDVKSTGFHWNGTNAGSRACLYNRETQVFQCGEAVW